MYRPSQCMICGLACDVSPLTLDRLRAAGWWWWTDEGKQGPSVFACPACCMDRDATVLPPPTTH